jgi:hypothetical protein
VWADPDLLGDLPVCQAARDLGEHLPLAAGKPAGGTCLATNPSSRNIATNP